MKLTRVKYNPIFILSLLTSIFLIYIMLGILIFKEQVFIERETLSLSEIFLGLGFVSIFVFNIVSIIWFFRNPVSPVKSTVSKFFLIALGVLCLLLLIGEKTMADEIGRESLLGWETLGEWIILYIFLFIQLAYNSVIINLSFKSSLHLK